MEAYKAVVDNPNNHHHPLDNVVACMIAVNTSEAVKKKFTLVE